MPPAGARKKFHFFNSLKEFCDYYVLLEFGQFRKLRWAPWYQTFLTYRSARNQKRRTISVPHGDPEHVWKEHFMRTQQHDLGYYCPIYVLGVREGLWVQDQTLKLEAWYVDWQDNGSEGFRINTAYNLPRGSTEVRNNSWVKRVMVTGNLQHLK